jgi:hypothetical protein
MLLINRSPGMFIVLANIVVFGVIGVEIWMWTAASTLAVAGTLALIAVTAGVICLSAVHLIDDASGIEPKAAPVAQPTPEPVFMTSSAVSPADVSVAVPAAARAPRTRTVAHV